MGDDLLHRRWGHVAVRVAHYILVIGGTWTSRDISSHHVIWMYNLYTEQWRKQVTYGENVPSPRCGASGTVIGADIYMFGGLTLPRGADTNQLWKLSTVPNECFVWNKLIHKSKAKSPSPRTWHSGWEYTGKLWIFGGVGDSLTGYLHESGNFANGVNNQLLCFDPSCKEWINPTCTGEIPEPRQSHGTAQIRNLTWLFGGCKTRNYMDFDSLYLLDMDSLTWTQVQPGRVMTWPAGRSSCTLTAITENQLLLHGVSMSDSASDTWIFDLTTMTWRAYVMVAEDKYHRRVYHSCTAGITSGNAVIIGGRLRDRRYQFLEDKQIMLVPKGLKHLAIQTIHKNREEFPVQLLPTKLRYLLHI